ncbi:hypothetical protein COCOBI_05-2020 [Coccomyxa sp. Obi]|nr:hypothetical protein COCOBI_05-2020 [Coccomyxa sp. Obi]
MVKEDTINMDVPCTVADFCELFKRADTVVGCHRETYNNDNIRVSSWDGPNRRVAFLAPYQAPGWVKKTIRYEVVKVVEQQHLEVVEEEGTVKSMTMTSSPSLYVPGMGNVSIGNVCFHVSADEEDEEACKVCTKLRCSAEQFKWLWAIRSIIEKIMLRECRTVAERFVEYCKRVVKEGAEHMRAEALKDMKPLNILSLPSGVDGSLSARSTDGCEASAGPASARGGGVTGRSLSRLSLASCNSIYYDASEDLEEPPLSSVATEEPDVLLRNPRTLHDTLTALQQQLHKMEGDINILLAAVEQKGQSGRSLGSRSSLADWELLLAGAAAGASICCTALWLTWRLRGMR